jgi:hypothetical protein
VRRDGQNEAGLLGLLPSRYHNHSGSFYRFLSIIGVRRAMKLSDYDISAL